MDYFMGIVIFTFQHRTYLNNIMKEVLRIFPPIGRGYRKFLKTFEAYVSIFNQTPDSKFRFWHNFTFFNVFDSIFVLFTRDLKYRLVGIVTYSIKITHEMSTLFKDDVTSFHPDRWQHIKDDSIMNCNFLPFGAGPRACVGKEYGHLFFRIFLKELLKRFDWNLLSEHPKLYTIPILKPSGSGLPVIFVDIRNTNEQHSDILHKQFKSVIKVVS